MHTIMVIVGGLVLLGLCVAIGRWTGAADPGAGMVRGARLFVPLWLVASGVNLWTGVEVAGYRLTDEAPIFLVVFAVPALAAMAVARMLRPHPG
jgi:hypothetical protein